MAEGRLSLVGYDWPEGVSGGIWLEGGCLQWDMTGGKVSWVGYDGGRGSPVGYEQII